MTPFLHCLPGVKTTFAPLYHNTCKVQASPQVLQSHRTAHRVHYKLVLDEIIIILIVIHSEREHIEQSQQLINETAIRPNRIFDRIKKNFKKNKTKAISAELGVQLYIPVIFMI